MRDLFIINSVNIIITYANWNKLILLKRILTRNTRALIINESELRRSNFLLTYKWFNYNSRDSFRDKERDVRDSKI